MSKFRLYQRRVTRDCVTARHKMTIILAMTLNLLTSCEKEIEFKGEQTDPKLVVNSLVEPGKRVEASMGKSCFFLQTPPDMQAPADLQALLYVNGVLVGGMTPFADTVWEVYGDDYTVRSGFYNDYLITSRQVLVAYCLNAAHRYIQGRCAVLAECGQLAAHEIVSHLGLYGIYSSISIGCTITIRENGILVIIGSLLPGSI